VKNEKKTEFKTHRCRRRFGGGRFGGQLDQTISNSGDGSEGTGISSLIGCSNWLIKENFSSFTELPTPVKSKVGMN
jgi:hypothetical protein